MRRAQCSYKKYSSEGTVKSGKDSYFVENG